MHDEGTDSHIKIFANIFISFIGAGILGLPYAFKEVGKPFCNTERVPGYCSLSVTPERYCGGDGGHEYSRSSQVYTHSL